jgi:hypothetical protein
MSLYVAIFLYAGEWKSLVDWWIKQGVDRVNRLLGVY